MEFESEEGPGVITSCFNTTLVFHTTEHPDGGFTATSTFVTSSRYTVTIGGTVVDSGSNKSQQHFRVLVDEDGTQVAHELSRSTFRGAEFVCTETVLFHAANGEVQVQRFESICEAT